MLIYVTIIPASELEALSSLSHIIIVSDLTDLSFGMPYNTGIFHFAFDFLQFVYFVMSLFSDVRKYIISIPTFRSPRAMHSSTTNSCERRLAFTLDGSVKVITNVFNHRRARPVIEFFFAYNYAQRLSITKNQSIKYTCMM